MVMAVLRAMSFTGPGVGMVGNVKTEQVGAPAAIAGSFVRGDFEISVHEQGDEARIEILTRVRTAWTDELKAEMRRAVDSLVAGLCLRTGVALEIEWFGANQVGTDGRRHLWAWEGVRVVKARDPIQSLGAYVADSQLIESHDELRAAVDQYAGSTLLAVDHPGASMALAYLAVEGLVTFVLGSTTGSLTSAIDWARAAPLLASNPDSLLHFLWSTQLGRHVDPVRARRELTNKGWKPLSATYCCELALDITVAYASTV